MKCFQGTSFIVCTTGTGEACRWPIESRLPTPLRKAGPLHRADDGGDRVGSQSPPLAANSAVEGVGAKLPLHVLHLDAYPGNVRGRRHPLLHGQRLHGGTPSQNGGHAGNLRPWIFELYPGQADDSEAQGRFPEGAGSQLLTEGVSRPFVVVRRSPGLSAAAGHVDGAGGIGYLE